MGVPSVPCFGKSTACIVFCYSVLSFSIFYSCDLSPFIQNGEFFLIPFFHPFSSLSTLHFCYFLFYIQTLSSAFQLSLFLFSFVDFCCRFEAYSFLLCCFFSVAMSISSFLLCLFHKFYNQVIICTIIFNLFYFFCIFVIFRRLT